MVALDSFSFVVFPFSSITCVLSLPCPCLQLWCSATAESRGAPLGRKGRWPAAAPRAGPMLWLLAPPRRDPMPDTGAGSDGACKPSSATREPAGRKDGVTAERADLVLHPTLAPPQTTQPSTRQSRARDGSDGHGRFGAAGPRAPAARPAASRPLPACSASGAAAPGPACEGGSGSLRWAERQCRLLPCHRRAPAAARHPGARGSGVGALPSKGAPPLPPPLPPSPTAPSPLFISPATSRWSIW